jgi:hypothetical protein
MGNFIIDLLNYENLNLTKENKKIKETLEKIKEFGYRESGRGYSCARMADKCLEELK